MKTKITSKAVKRRQYDELFTLHFNVWLAKASRRVKTLEIKRAYLKAMYVLSAAANGKSK